MSPFPFSKGKEERNIFLVFLYRLSDNGSRNLTEGEIVHAARLSQNTLPLKLDFCRSVEYSSKIDALLSDLWWEGYIGHTVLLPRKYFFEPLGKAKAEDILRSLPAEVREKIEKAAGVVRA